MVLHNNDLGQVSWEMRTEDGNPLWPTSQDVESMDYAGWAELVGFKGIRVKSDDEVAKAWDEAFAHEGITLIDAYTSKNVPPLPPHITRELAKNTAEALLKGDPEEMNVIRDTAKGPRIRGRRARQRRVAHRPSRSEADDGVSKSRE